MKGRLIAFEGGEGAGKSTQARLLAEWIAGQGRSVLATREPGGTPGAEAIRNLLLDPPDTQGWTTQAEALLFAAARAEHVARAIRPALERGSWVICDRFIASSQAYQGGAGGLGDEAIRSLHAIGSGGLLPDLTVLLEVSEAHRTERLAQRDQGNTDAIGSRSAAYHRKVAEHFRKLAQANSECFAIVDANGSPDSVQDAVRSLVLPYLEAQRT